MTSVQAKKMPSLCPLCSLWLKAFTTEDTESTELTRMIAKAGLPLPQPHLATRRDRMSEPLSSDPLSAVRETRLCPRYRALRLLLACPLIRSHPQQKSDAVTRSVAPRSS